MSSPLIPWLRASMPVARRFAYFDHAAVAPLPGPVCEAITTWAREAAELGDTVWPEWARGVERARRLAAAMIGAQTEEIALAPNTTSGISLIAEGLPWTPGDNVVTLANEFPSNIYPWQNLASRGVETRLVAVDDGCVTPQQIAAACDARTRLVSVSWVGYATGWRLDLDELAEQVHARGALLLIDAIQGLGVFPIDVGRTAIDFLAADGHKWLLGPEGAGLLYVRNEHLERLRPLGVGWNSVVHRYDFSRLELTLRPEAARYEGGSLNMAGFLGLAAALDLLTQAGVSPGSSPVADAVLATTDQACERLLRIGARIVSRREGERRSGIVGFQMPGRDPTIVRQHCLEAGVVLSCRAGMLRLSPHAYNDSSDVERLAAAIVSART